MGSPILLWRIGTETPRYRADDLTGVGAKLAGGRWNRRRTPLVYASASRALACLETMTRLGDVDRLPLNRYLVEITIPEAAWRKRAVFVAADHVGWDAEPAGKTSLDWGTAWAREGLSLVAEVPSVIVPEESNVLLNPLRRDITSVTARKIRRWTYDARIRLDLR